MFNVIQPVPRWMAQTPMYLVGSETSTSVTVNTPAGIQDGDLIIGWGYTATTITMSAPSGFTDISYGNSSYGGRVQYYGAWSRIASSEGATIMLKGKVCGLLVYRNASNIDAFSSFATTGHNEIDPSSISIPSITMSASGTLIALIGQEGNLNMDSIPSGMTLKNAHYDSGDAVGIKMYSQSLGPGSTGGKTFTLDDASPAVSPAMAGIIVAIT